MRQRPGKGHCYFHVEGPPHSPWSGEAEGANRRAEGSCLGEGAGREADNHFDRMVEPVTEDAGDASGNAGDTGNKWLPGHDVPISGLFASVLKHR